MSLSAGAARAQKESAPPAGYTQLVERALSEFDAQNYFEARSLFTRAHALYPNARTLRGLGVVEFALRNYEVAADYLARALQSNERPLTGELRATTEKLLTQSREYLAHVEVTVVPTEADARVLLDGEAVALVPGKPLVLKVGDHVLEAQADGYLPERRTLRIQGGETLQVELALHPVGGEANIAQDESQPAQQLAANAAPAQPSERGPGVWPWVVVGAGGAVLITGGVLAVMGEHDIAKVEDPDKGTPWSELKAAHDRGPTLATTGFVLVGVGAAAVATGLLWKFVWSDQEPANANVAIGPRSIAVSARF
jgi:hypothetical protein